MTEELARRMALSINGGDWEADYTDAQKRGWLLKAEFCTTEANAQTALALERAVSLVNTVEYSDRPSWANVGSWAHCAEIYAMRIHTLITADHAAALQAERLKAKREGMELAIKATSDFFDNMKGTRSFDGLEQAIRAEIEKLND